MIQIIELTCLKRCKINDRPGSMTLGQGYRLSQDMGIKCGESTNERGGLSIYNYGDSNNNEDFVIGTGWQGDYHIDGSPVPYYPFNCHWRVKRPIMLCDRRRCPIRLRSMVIWPKFNA